MVEVVSGSRPVDMRVVAVGKKDWTEDQAVMGVGRGRRWLMRSRGAGR